MKRMTWLLACLASLCLVTGCGSDDNTNDAHAGSDAASTKDAGDVGETDDADADNSGDAGADTDDGGDSSRDGGGASDLEVFGDQLVAEITGAYCETLYAGCEATVNIQTWFGWLERASSQRECEEVSRESLKSQYDFESLAVMDQAELDEDAAETCLSQLRSAREADVCWIPSGNAMEACTDAIRGQVDEGEPCVNGLSCESGLCQSTLGDSSDDCNRGSCAPPPTIVGEGRACDYTSGQACDESEDLICDVHFIESSPDICVKRFSRSEGEPCRSSRVCEMGLACIDGDCTNLEPGGEGDECVTEPTSDDPFQPCQPQFTCVDETPEDPGTCIAPVSEGEACTSTEECALNLNCDQDDGVCRPANQKGDTCTEEELCEDGLVCLVNEGEEEGECVDLDQRQCEAPDGSG